MEGVMVKVPAIMAAALLGAMECPAFGHINKTQESPPKRGKKTFKQNKRKQAKRRKK